MTQSFFETYLSCISRKYNLHATNESERNDRKKYAEGLIDEVREVGTEAKENNVIYLEDELGDILWDYMNMLYIFQKEGKIDSIESVFERSLRKYRQRIEAIDIDGEIDLKTSNWDAVKKKQKEENKTEHQQRYEKELFVVEPIADPYTLPFAPWLIQQIKDKSKWKTYRLGSKYDYLKVGDIIRVTQVDTGEYIGKANVVSKNYMKFGEIPLDCGGHEKYRDREVMRRVFNGYYAYIERSIEDNDDFLVIEFSMIE